MIKLENLTKHFKVPGKPPVIATSNINMNIPSGEICVFLGPSGCGKTTTLKMINKLISKTSGKIFINGEDIDTIDTIQLRRTIGYVIQQIGLFPNLTIEDNICVVPDLLKTNKAKSRRRAVELLEMVNLDPSMFLKRYPKELSGGQQQRIGVIRALAADPPVMLMDEPFGAIDPINRAVIQDEFLNLNKVLGKTVLFVSHDIDEAIKMADKIAIFRDGTLEQIDTPDEILANPVNDFVREFVGIDSSLKRLKLVDTKQALLPFTGSLKPNDLIEVARKCMLENNVEFLLITEANGKLVGYVTSNELNNSNSGSIMQHSLGTPPTINIKQNLHVAVSLMYSKSMNWLAVIDDDLVYQGYITQLSISAILAKSGKQK